MGVCRLLARVARHMGDNRYLRSALDIETRLKGQLNNPQTDFNAVCQRLQISKNDIAGQKKRLPRVEGEAAPTKQDALLAYCREKGKLWALAVALGCVTDEDL